MRSKQRVMGLLKGAPPRPGPFRVALRVILRVVAMVVGKLVVDISRLSDP